MLSESVVFIQKLLDSLLLVVGRGVVAGHRFTRNEFGGKDSLNSKKNNLANIVSKTN